MADYKVDFEYNYQSDNIFSGKIELFEAVDILRECGAKLDVLDVLAIQVFVTSDGYDIFVQLLDEVREYKLKFDSKEWWHVKNISKKIRSGSDAERNQTTFAS